ncbi:MAG TPA: DUF2569 family protein [Microvirga sp.]|jgi:hypothetical protein
METNASAPTAEPATTDAMPAHSTPRGVRGWLLLPAIFAFIAPLGYMANAALVLTRNTAELTIPSVPHQMIVASELIVSALMTIAWLYACKKLVKKKMSFTKVFICLIWVDIAAEIWSFLLFDNEFRVDTSDFTIDYDELLFLFCYTIFVGLLSIYMLVSKRVRNTFVEP